MADQTSRRRRRDDSDDDEAVNHRAAKRTRSSAKRSMGEASHNFEAHSQAMVEALKDAGGRIQRHIANLPARAVQIDERGQQVLRERQPPKTFNGLLHMLPTATIDDIWTREKEEEFETAFASSPYRRFMRSNASFPANTNHNYWTMWKTIPRLRNCFPTDIIGPKSYLKYEIDVDVGGGEMRPDPRWSSGFCERLTDLALGSPCGANMGLLGLLIRYTVADRLDDRRQMPLDDHHTRDQFFHDLAARVKRENHTRSLRHLHADLRQDWEEAGDFVPWVSDVMCSIEQLNESARSPQPTMPVPGEAFPEYAVQTIDLTRLTKACDQTGDLGYASLDTVEQRAAFIAHGRTKQDPLQHKNREQLNQLRIPLLKDEERFKARRILLSQLRRDNTSSSDSDPGSYAPQRESEQRESEEREFEDPDFLMHEDSEDPDFLTHGDTSEESIAESEVSWGGCSGEGSLRPHTSDDDNDDDDRGLDFVFDDEEEEGEEDHDLDHDHDLGPDHDHPDPNNEDPPITCPQSVSRKRRRAVPCGDQACRYVVQANPRNVLVTMGPWDIMAAAQPLNLLEARLSCAKRPTAAVQNTGNLPQGLAKNMNSMLLDLGRIGRLD
ncbi:hypothetical protein F5Y01DRAFT_40381 [Xylaria sp. FL0043]|nr:hypothetical protein F5Y01DRAFT_40381 [Xylaria sp. FL0043]